MNLRMSSTNAVIVAVVAVAVLVGAFWVLALSPKKDEAKKLGAKVENLEAKLSEHRAEANEAAAKDSRPTTSSWSRSARPFRATTTPRRCWSSSTGSPNART
jgi:hypothetical protein